MAREFTNGFYKTREWTECRKAYVSMVGGLCEDCLAKGLYTAGVIVHHKIHLTPENITDQEIRTGFNNLKLVCRKCHEEEHKVKIQDRYSFDEEGNIHEVQRN